MLPKSEDTEAHVRQLAAKRLVGLLKGAKSTDEAKALTFDDVETLIGECFA